MILTRNQHPPFPTRPSFTLVELLVVIAIIATLVALTAGAVFQVMVRVPQVATRTEIGNFTNGIASAKKELGDVSYLPSQIILCKNATDYGGSALEVSSKAFLYRAFGKYLWTGGPVNWDNGAASGPFTLNADQTLVFWLGGIPGPSGTTLGFSSDPRNPANFTGGSKKGPYFDFQTNRMVAGSGSAPFYAYLDAYKKNRYLYFSSKGQNDYTLTGEYSGVNPYERTGSGSTPSTKLWINANSYQIISAGRDGNFGAGGIFDPGTGTTDANGRDDIANFSPNILGAPAN